jgi:hypothetical protein
MRYSCFIWILISIGLISCEDKKTEIVNLNDVLPSSERYAEGKEQEKDTVIIQYYDSLNTNLQRISDTLKMEKSSVQFVDSTWLPDRFQHRSIQKWSGNNGFSNVLIAQYAFADSISMKNTLFNWLDCFGKQCKSLQLFEELKMINNRAFVLFSTEKELIYYESDSKINEKEILANLNRLNSKAEVKYVITQNLGGKTQWWKLDKKIWTILKKEEI